MWFWIVDGVVHPTERLLYTKSPPFPFCQQSFWYVLRDLFGQNNMSKEGPELMSTCFKITEEDSEKHNLPVFIVIVVILFRVNNLLTHVRV